MYGRLIATLAGNNHCRPLKKSNSFHFRCLSGGQQACTLIGCLGRGRQDFVLRGDRCYDSQRNRFRKVGETWSVDCANTCR